VAKETCEVNRSLEPVSVRNVTSYEGLVAGWENVSSRLGFRFRQVPCDSDDRSLMLVEYGPAGAPVAHLTAGVHGDEPAGPWALLSSVEAGLLDTRFAYRIWPCTNPSGYRAGTRVNADGKDVNRSFSEAASTTESRAIMAENRKRRFTVAMDLHEDFEADGFYCYEPVVEGRAPLSEAILEAIELAGFPLQSLDHLFDLGYPRDPRKADRLRTLERGRVLVNAAAETRLFPGLPLSLYLLRSSVKRYVTAETPRCRSWEDRITMHRVAVATALAGAASLYAKARAHA
jgi:murein peptide amidase A